MIITTFFIQDANFHNVKQCEEFATAMLYWNCYLFSENEGDDYKVQSKTISILNLKFW